MILSQTNNTNILSQKKNKDSTVMKKEKIPYEKAIKQSKIILSQLVYLYHSGLVYELPSNKYFGNKLDNSSYPEIHI